VGGHCRVVGQLLGPAPDLDEVAVGNRVEQRGDHRRGVIERSAAAGQPPRGPQVRQLAAQGGVGLRLALGGHGGGDPRGQLDGPAQHAAGCGLVLAGRRQPVEAERPQRVQHAVPGAPRELGVDHGGVDEAGQDASRITFQAQLGGEPLGGVEVDAVGEDRQVPEQSPFVVREELVGPLDGRA
jgi:hypothetical protein